MQNTDILLSIISILLLVLSIMAGLMVHIAKKISAKVDSHTDSISEIDKKLSTHIEKCTTTHKFLELINQLDPNKREEILATVDNLNKRK
jgi:predicted PurR-regulated permease PerM